MINIIDINYQIIIRQIEIYNALHNKSPTIYLSHKTYEVLKIYFKHHGLNYLTSNSLCGSDIKFDENLPFGMINFE